MEQCYFLREMNKKPLKSKNIKKKAFFPSKFFLFRKIVEPDKLKENNKIQFVSHFLQFDTEQRDIIL